jgi:hypothetical protein
MSVKSNRPLSTQLMIVAITGILVLISSSTVSAGFLEWLRRIAEIRDSCLVLIHPHGQTFLSDTVSFNWNLCKQAHHLELRVFEKAPGTTDKQVFEASVPGTEDRYPATLDLSQSKNYYWELRVFWNDSSTSNRIATQAFSYIHPSEADHIRANEKLFETWIKSYPSEKHLLLLQAAYYAGEGMHFHAAESFIRFLNLSRYPSYKALTQMVLANLEPVRREREAAEKILKGSEGLIERKERAARLYELDLMLLDYPAALKTLDDLLRLNAGTPALHQDWLKKKRQVVAEYQIYRAAFGSEAQS